MFIPVIIDIKEAARYQQGVEEGDERRTIETARKMFQNGLEFSLVENITGLEKSKLEEIARSVSQS